MQVLGNILKTSWERSRRYAVDPLKAREAILDESEWKKYREQKESFLRQIRPVLERMNRWLKSSYSTVVVCDPSGIILETIGDPKFLKDAEKIHISKGACWSEKVKGTNAGGTVIIEKKPLAVVGTDHYLEDHHFIYCAASPIFNLFGELISVLDISGHRDQYHPSILMMVDVIAREIEDQMLIHQQKKQLVLSLHQENQHHRILLAVNEEGRVIGANREARSLIDIKGSDFNKIGISDLFTGVEPLLQRGRRALTNDRFNVSYNQDGKTKWIASVLMDSRSPYFFVHKEQSKTRLPKPAVKYTFDDIFGKDPQFQSVLELARRAALTDYTILINGESGTGKEMISQAIHHASKRSDKPFVALNCGAISKSLMESELFGYEAGSFTGATKTGRIGKIELANGGTLFLDEIAEMPSEMQVALLRVLQESTVVRVGGLKPVEVDVRIIAATHKDLWQEVQEGRFRADLFYRLLGIHLRLPPLRERKDCLDLTDYFLQNIKKEIGKERLILSRRAKKLIRDYSWPGNVRELVSALRYAAFLTPNELIEFHHFPQYILTKEIPSSSTSLKELEKDAILETLKKTEGNVTQAALLLGISRNTLYRKLKKKG